MPLLMSWPALDPSAGSAISALLEKVAREGQARAVAAVARILARSHDFSWDKIAPAVNQLRLQEQDESVLELISAVLGRIRLAADRGAFELGSILGDLLLESENREDVDPSVLAAIAWSARNRLAVSTSRPNGNPHGEELLSLAERLSTKLSPQLSPPSPVLPPRSPWPSKRLTFAEFAAQWSGISGIRVDWLPMMSLGSAGERIDGTVRAKPGKKGHIVYGPYLRLPPGDHHVRVRMETGRPWRWNYRRQPIAKLGAFADHGEIYLTHHNVE